MKKSNKVLTIVLLSLLFCCGVAYIVLYCLYPVKTQTITLDTIDYICNKPLPVVGVSILVLAIALYKIIKFIIIHKGTKISELKEEIAQLKKDLLASQEESKIIAQSLFNYQQENNDHLKEICGSIPNKKVKTLGDKFYGKEIDNKTETKEI